MAVENEAKDGVIDVNGQTVNITDEDREDGQDTKDSSSVIEVEFDVEKQHVLELGQMREDDVDASSEIPVEDDVDVAESNVAQRQANTYAAKKTVAQGMMDIALITANANQLRYIIEFNSGSSTYYLNLFLITVSLLLQVAVGVSLIFKGRLDLRGESKHKQAKKINNYVVVCIFLVTIINVFIASFTITGKGNQQH